MTGETSASPAALKTDGATVLPSVSEVANEGHAAHAVRVEMSANFLNIDSAPFLEISENEEHIASPNVLVPLLLCTITHPGVFAVVKNSSNAAII